MPATPPIPHNENERLQALLDYKVLDTLSEREFDNITQLASYICDTPIALISLIDDKRQWFKSAIGLDVASTSRDISFCQHAILDHDIFEVQNALKDDEFKKNILVTSSPNIRFYAGAPLQTPNGYHIGTLCVIDTKPKKLSNEQKTALKTLSEHVINLLELRRTNVKLSQKNDETIKSHQLLQKLSEQVPGAIYQYQYHPNGDNYFPFASKNIYDIYELTPEEIIKDATKVFSRVHPDDVERVGNSIIKSFETLEVWTDEYRVVLPNKGTRWVRGNSNPEKLQDGSVLWHGYLQDVSESKKLSGQVSNLVSVQKSILDGASYSIIFTDIEGVIVNINKAALDLLEYEESEVLNILTPAPFHDSNEVMTRSKILSDELQRYVEPGFETFVAKARAFDCADANEWTYVSKYGKRIPVWLSVTCIKNSKNELIGYLGIAEDYRLKKAYEVELIESKLFAEKASSAKDVFLANMSHEMRTPLNAIIGFTNLLEETKLEAKQIEYVSSVKTAGENLLRIINEILDISKIESGKLVIDNHVFNLAVAMKQVYQLFKIKALEKGIRLNLLLDADLPKYIISDPTRLNQILINLVGNAVKFTTEGSVTIELQSTVINESKSNVFFIIKDTGIGIANDQLNNVFERFTQAEGSTTREYGGTGLGLNIAKELVQLLGGEIIVESKLNIGSEFSFELEFDTTTVQKQIPSQKYSTILDKRLSILLCEDNILNQKLILNVIEQFGYSITITNNGKEGVDLLKKNNFDLIIMDLQMPVMDGYQATDYIRNTLKSRIPIIAMTAHSFIEERKKCLAIGMDEYITKPFKKDQLIAKIKEVVQNAKPEINKSIKEHKITLFDVDYDYLEDLSGGDVEFEISMIETFIKLVPQDMTLLSNAIEQNDTKMISRFAHKLKSSFGLFNLDEELAVLNKLEIAPDEISIDLKEQYKTVIRSIDAILIALEHKLKDTTN